MDKKEFADNEQVFIWRSVPGHKGWTGPGTIIAQKGDSFWISMRGYLVKANRGQLRHATAEESLGAELVKHLSTQLLEDIENNQVKFFRDVEGEGLPEMQPEMAEGEGDPPEMAGPALEPYSPSSPVATPMVLWKSYQKKKIYLQIWSWMDQHNNQKHLLKRALWHHL